MLSIWKRFILYRLGFSGVSKTSENGRKVLSFTNLSNFPNICANDCRLELQRFRLHLIISGGRGRRRSISYICIFMCICICICICFCIFNVHVCVCFRYCIFAFICVSFFLHATHYGGRGREGLTCQACTSLTGKLYFQIFLICVFASGFSLCVFVSF